jgi:predicted ATPase
LGGREESGQQLLATLAVALCPRRLLLVLDNCEHLLDVCAALAEALLRAFPHVTFLPIIREVPGLAGEVVTPLRVFKSSGSLSPATIG